MSTRFYPLKVAEVRRETPDAVSIVLEPPADARDAFRYYLGTSNQRPMFGRFTYAEKMEYWALVWGMFVMASTGLMAWFKVGVGGLVRRLCPATRDRRVFAHVSPGTDRSVDGHAPVQSGAA